MFTPYIYWVYQTKYYYGSVKKSKFSFGWHLQIYQKSIMQKKIKEFKKKECSAYYRILFTLKNII